jgi:hypothetical protein
VLPPAPCPALPASQPSLGPPIAEQRRWACSKYRERGSWKKGAGIGGQDQCVTMQMAIGSFILFWIGYVLWMTWELKQVRDAKLRPTDGV